jgi:hypothetical protein
MVQVDGSTSMEPRVAVRVAVDLAGAELVMSGPPWLRWRRRDDWQPVLR